MYIPAVRFHDPASVEEASLILSENQGSAQLMAGGTDLLVILKAQPSTIRHIVTLKRVKSMTGIRESAGSVEIGALTTPATLADSPEVHRYAPSLLDAVHELAAVQIRNMATIGGNIASAVPSADLPPILIALDASIETQTSRGQRTIPLQQLFLGPRKTALEPDEVITAVTIPKPSARHGAAFQRVANRQANACAVAGVAVGVSLSEGDIIHRIQLVLCAVAPTPYRVEKISTTLEGQKFSEELLAQAAAMASEAAVPISDVRSTSTYRRHIVSVLTRRALSTAVQRAREAA